MLGVKGRIGKRRPEYAVDQFLRQAATAAVADGDFGPMRQWDGTGKNRGRVGGHIKGMIV
jgi:hypothetical protein